MNAAFWITQTVEEFGRMLGFEELAFDDRGVLQLDIEDRGVGIEVALIARREGVFEAAQPADAQLLAMLGYQHFLEQVAPGA